MTAHVQAKRRAQHANGGAHGDDLADDLLYGCAQIGNFLGWPVRRVRHAVACGHLPASRSGAIYIGSKKRLRRHLQGEAAEE